MVDRVKDMIIAYCKEHYPEADGLCSGDCGCSFDELQPCASCCMDCVPAKWDEEKEIFMALKTN